MDKRINIQLISFRITLYNTLLMLYYKKKSSLDQSFSIISEVYSQIMMRYGSTVVS